MNITKDMVYAVPETMGNRCNGCIAEYDNFICGGLGSCNDIIFKLKPEFETPSEKKMSNTPQQQAELYRKAAETIEMCAPYGIEPSYRYAGVIINLCEAKLSAPINTYEFPIAVIEGQLVWADTVVYDQSGGCLLAGRVITNYWEYYTLTPPKQPLCEVEGKPVYKGDKLWSLFQNRIYVVEKGLNDPQNWSWNPPKRTVMVELLAEDAERLCSVYRDGYYERITGACRKALDNLK